MRRRWMPGLHWPVVVLAVAVAVAGVAGCTGPVAPPAGPLVTVETRGGECFAAPCGRTIMIERDGRVHEAAKPPNDLGQVPPALLETLETVIATTDFGAIKSQPFSGDCPTAYDGQETVYTFSAPGGTEVIASCTFVVDPARPIFASVDAAIAAAGQP